MVATARTYRKTIMTKNSCPICATKQVKTFLRRRDVTVHQNLPFADPQSAKKIARGDLMLGACQNCGFIFNQEFDSSKLNYGSDYDNNQNCSAAFNNHLDSLVCSLVEKKNVRNSTIVEVGCGQGEFIKKLVEPINWGNRGYGFDPSYMGIATDLDGRLQFQQRYYGADCANIAADVVICRHVIEHVPDPMSMLETVGQALKGSTNAKVFFETPCVEWILHNQVFWDFFYEHCSYFTANSLRYAFELAGFQVDRVDHIFGDQYLWLEATYTGQHRSKVPDSSEILELVQDFQQHSDRLETEWHDKIQSLGRVALWGAGAKGVTLANLVDPQQNLIDSIIDLNPNKQGKYIPGTGHPIISYQQIKERGLTHAILMNPNYYDENVVLLERANVSLNLVR
jgi:SAM-dependent methyltransferase